MAVFAIVSMSAATDGQTYAEVNGLKIKNLWQLDRVHTPEAWANAGACNTRARTAVMAGDIVYVARSEAKAVVVAPGDTVSASVIYRYNVADGSELTPLDVTYAGRPYGVFLGVNQIGVDNFGHVWIAPYTSATATSIPFYTLDTESGELTLIADLEKGDVLARTDYADLVGDITREQADCKIVSMAASAATVYSWYAEQGGDFEGGFEGDTYLDIVDFYPESVTNWSFAPFGKILLGEDEDNLYTGDLMYLDGFASMPALYSSDGSLIESFENVDADLWPETGTNGVNEFKIDGRNFIVYSIAQYSGDGHGCQANICELGPDMALEGMTKYWQIPADSLGKVSDGGLRVHVFNVQYSKDAQGDEVVTLFNFKTYNGMGVYQIGKNVGGDTPDTPDPVLKGDINGDGIVDITDVNMVINMVLGKLDKTTAADIDGSGDVDITDVNLVINVMLGK